MLPNSSSIENRNSSVIGYIGSNYNTGNGVINYPNLQSELITSNVQKLQSVGIRIIQK